MSSNNKPAERKQAVIFPLVTRVERHNERPSRELKRQKKILTSSEQKEIRVGGEMTMEQIIDRYKNKYEREAEESYSFAPLSPRMMKPRKSTMLALLFPAGSTCQPPSMIKNKASSFNKEWLTPRRSKLAIDTSKEMSLPFEQQQVTKKKRRQLRRHLNLLIKKGSTNTKRRYYNTDASLNSPRADGLLIEQSVNISFEKLKMKLQQQEYINSHAIQCSYPESSRFRESSLIQRVDSFVPKCRYLGEYEEQEETLESEIRKAKRYVDTTIEELCQEDKQVMGDKINDTFFKVNTKMISSRPPPLPVVSAILRQYKSKKPLNSQYLNEREEVSGWGQQQPAHRYHK